MLAANAASYRTALIPMTVKESTTLASMADKRAIRDRDWHDLRAVLQWKLRTRRFLLSFIENHVVDSFQPISMQLASIKRIIQEYPESPDDLARQMDRKLPDLALNNELRLSEKEWLQLSDDLLRVIRISNEEEWSAQAINVLRELRVERFKLDNPSIAEEEVNAYFPIPDTDNDEAKKQDTILSKMVKNSITNTDQLPADLRITTRDMDAKNADMRSKLLAEIVLAKDFKNLPKSLRKRIQVNPVFQLLSKRGPDQAGSNEFDDSERFLEAKARLVAEAFYLRPPMDQETALPAFGSSKMLYAMPTVAKELLDPSFIATKGSAVIIEVNRASSQLTFVDNAQFLSNLIFAFNLPQNRNPESPDLPVPLDRTDQDDLSSADWNSWAERSELTSLLNRAELDQADAKQKWFEIFKLLRSYRVTPILVFKNPLDFTMFRIILDLDHWSQNQRDMSFAAGKICDINYF